MSGSTARPDLAADAESLRLPIDELVARLREMLGAKLVAYVASQPETRTVRAWASGERAPSHEAEVRLRLAYRVAALLSERNTSEVAQVWFQGANELLGDRAPAKLLREGALANVAPVMVAAARDFSS